MPTGRLEVGLTLTMVWSVVAALGWAWAHEYRSWGSKPCTIRRTVLEGSPVVKCRSHLKQTCSRTDEHGVEFNRRYQRKDTHERQRLPAAHQVADCGFHLRPAERRFAALPSPVRLSRLVANEKNAEDTF